MAIIKQNVMGDFHGKVGTLTTYMAPAGNIARVRTNSTNVGDTASRTDKQQTNRVRWANLVNFYKASADWMKKAYEGKLKKHSDYNQFMSMNFERAHIALTKQQAAAGACVVEDFMVTQGSLVPVTVRKSGRYWQTNIICYLTDFNLGTTVAEFSQDLIENNSFIRHGMQLSFISYQQVVDDSGIPRVICTPYELRIDRNDNVHRVKDYLPDFACSLMEGHICTGDDISVGAFAYVLSETRNGTTKVSSQSLIVTNAALISRFSSAEQIQAAIDSYGKSSDVFLDSGSATEKSATPQPNYVDYIVGNNGTVIPLNGGAKTFNDLFGLPDKNEMSVYMANEIPSETVVGVVLVSSYSESVSCQVRAVNGKQIRISMYSTDYSKATHAVWNVNVQLNDVIYDFDLLKPKVEKL